MRLVTLMNDTEASRLCHRHLRASVDHFGLRLDTLVLSGVASRSDVAREKLRILEIFADDVFYIDVDTVFVNRPDFDLLTQNRSFKAVLDQPLRGSELNLVVSRGANPALYVNTGVMYIPRELKPVLTMALAVMNEPYWSSVLLEQTALNLAIQKTQTAMTLLPPSYNRLLPLASMAPLDTVIVHGAGVYPKTKFYEGYNVYRP